MCGGERDEKEETDRSTETARGDGSPPGASLAGQWQS